VACASDTLLIIFAAAEKEIVGAALAAEMTPGKKVGAFIADILETDGTLPQMFHIFGSRTDTTFQSYRHGEGPRC
jgi:hypothetical protein